MAHYFLHLVDGEDVLLDPDGVEGTEDEVKEIALHSARDCVAGDAHTGQINLACRIDIHDAAGAVVHSLPFDRAVTIKS